MAKNNKIRMPMSTGGITRFSGEYKSKIEFRPHVVIFVCVIALVFMIILHTQGAALLGM